MGFFTSFNKGRERAKKEACIRRVIEMIKNGEDKEVVAKFLNENNISSSEVNNYAKLHSKNV